MVNVRKKTFCFPKIQKTSWHHHAHIQIKRPASPPSAAGKKITFQAPSSLGNEAPHGAVFFVSKVWAFCEQSGDGSLKEYLVFIHVIFEKKSKHEVNRTINKYIWKNTEHKHSRGKKGSTKIIQATPILYWYIGSWSGFGHFGNRNHRHGPKESQLKGLEGWWITLLHVKLIMSNLNVGPGTSCVSFPVSFILNCNTLWWFPQKKTTSPRQSCQARYWQGYHLYYTKLLQGNNLHPMGGVKIKQMSTRLSKHHSLLKVKKNYGATPQSGRYPSKDCLNNKFA